MPSIDGSKPSLNIPTHLVIPEIFAEQIVVLPQKFLIVQAATSPQAAQTLPKVLCGEGDVADYLCVMGKLSSFFMAYLEHMAESEEEYFCPRTLQVAVDPLLSNGYYFRYMANMPGNPPKDRSQLFTLDLFSHLRDETDSDIQEESALSGHTDIQGN